MNNIKHLFINRFKTFALLSISLMFCIVLLMLRIKFTHSFFYLFLVWNLFLAAVPFAITTYLVSLPKLNKFGLLVWFCVWLLFLPNAPYIVTDLIHLQLSTAPIIWLDILIVSTFASNGLLLFYLSIFDMRTILKPYLTAKLLNCAVLFILFLSSFGVYLGRFLRYNSWEILSHPKYLITDVLNIITQPSSHKEAWIFTLLFGAFLYIGFLIFKNLFNSDKNTL
ncbi:DUF1361 domain-containing protein [Hwangdonia lutea]|uniref:DUF1361 domain-containing protein n=1 Tax=Hwangdonia lutea TaxID=3075823 RepID=A0AA97EKW7_9FLAO|nr:DUF1361 domain-containing protein [Hwangdonia sp. SCSIO 19198]WOD42891.1 DUF1361 domain-containing protein [Hwangdonia sp. SCSIO 19198]